MQFLLLNHEEHEETQKTSELNKFLFVIFVSFVVKIKTKVSLAYYIFRFAS